MSSRDPADKLDGKAPSTRDSLGPGTTRSSLRDDPATIDRPRSWRPPTRRAFVSMLGAAAAALALRDTTRQEPADPPRSTWAGTTRWIGHC